MWDLSTVSNAEGGARLAGGSSWTLGVQKAVFSGSVARRDAGRSSWNLHIREQYLVAI